LSKNESINDLTLIIGNGIIDIAKNITLNNKIHNLIIIGDSKDNSTLNFNTLNTDFIFVKSVNKIKLNKITIKGSLKFFNNIEVEIDDVNIYGTLTFNNQCSSTKCTENQSININNLNFYSETDSNEYCINLFGNVKINNALFYGNPSCKNGIMKYDGENINNIEITNSYFNGEFSNQCLKIVNSLKSYILSSTFRNGASLKNGG